MLDEMLDIGPYPSWFRSVSSGVIGSHARARKLTVEHIGRRLKRIHDVAIDVMLMSGAKSMKSARKKEKSR